MSSLTKKHDESTDEAGERHADVVGVPLGRVGDDVAVVAGAEGESHISGGENLNGKDDRLERGRVWERSAPGGLGNSQLRHFKSFQMIQDYERG